jgi:NAD-dependent deacetylase
LPADVWERAVEQTANCECFLVVGTSGVVYPAAGLIDGARAVGASIIEINLEATAATGRVDVALHGKSGEILPRLLAMLKGEPGAAATGGIRA